jgi:cell division protein FtsL
LEVLQSHIHELKSKIEKQKENNHKINRKVSKHQNQKKMNDKERSKSKSDPCLVK